MIDRKELTKLEDSLKDILISMWGAGLDFGTSEDFKDLEGDEKDEVYLRYQTNKANICISQVKQVFGNELNQMTYGDWLYKLIKKEMLERGNWANTPRGKPFVKGYDSRRKETLEQQRYENPYSLKTPKMIKSSKVQSVKKVKHY